MNTRKLLSASVVLAITAITSLSGCESTSQSEQTGSATAGTTPKETNPTEISIMSTFFTAEPPGADNVIVKEVEKKTNTKLKISWVSQNNYNDKVNVTLASGDMPDLLLISDPYHPQVRLMAQQGAFWDLTPYVKNYKNLAALSADSWNNTKIDGKNFGIPRYRPLDGGGGMPLIRKDWLTKLNLKEPSTMDELYTVMKAFTEKDPDGNGKNDTVGLTGSVDQDSMGNLSFVENTFNGTNGAWKLKDGKLVPTIFEQGTKDALIWLNKAYSEKLISEDFATLKATQLRDLVKANKAGMWADAVNPSWLLTGEMRKTNPEADLLPLTSLAGPEGKPFVPRDSGSFGMFVIPKTVKEDKMKKILEFMDYGASEEGWVTANFGLKDVHYTEKDGIRVTNEQAVKDNVAAGAFGQIFSSLDKYARAYNAGIPKDFLERNKKIIDARSKISTPDVAIGLKSDTYDKFGKEYDKKIQDLKVKVIIGSAPMKQWDDFVNGLKNDPNFQKIIKEMNEAYSKK